MAQTIPDLVQIKSQNTNWGIESNSINGNFQLLKIFLDSLDLRDQVQSDWNETDETSLAFIKNKPDMELFILVGELPEVGIPNKFYLVPHYNSTEEIDSFEEYIWTITDDTTEPPTYGWEYIGSKTVPDTIDLTNYWSKDEITNTMVASWSRLSLNLDNEDTLEKINNLKVLIRKENINLTLDSWELDAESGKYSIKISDDDLFSGCTVSVVAAPDSDEKMSELPFQSYIPITINEEGEGSSYFTITCREQVTTDLVINYVIFN